MFNCKKNTYEVDGVAINFNLDKMTVDNAKTFCNRLGAQLLDASSTAVREAAAAYIKSCIKRNELFVVAGGYIDGTYYGPGDPNDRSLFPKEAPDHFKKCSMNLLGRDGVLESTYCAAKNAKVMTICSSSATEPATGAALYILLPMLGIIIFAIVVFCVRRKRQRRQETRRASRDAPAPTVRFHPNPPNNESDEGDSQRSLYSDPSESPVAFERNFSDDGHPEETRIKRVWSVQKDGGSYPDTSGLVNRGGSREIENHRRYQTHDLEDDYDSCSTSSSSSSAAGERKSSLKKVTLNVDMEGPSKKDGECHFILSPIEDED